MARVGTLRFDIEAIALAGCGSVDLVSIKAGAHCFMTVSDITLQ